MDFPDKIIPALGIYGALAQIQKAKEEWNLLKQQSKEDSELNAKGNTLAVQNDEES